MARTPPPISLKAFLMAPVLAILAAPSHAQDTAEDPRSFVVVGVAGLPEFETADDLQVVPLVVSNFNAFGARVELEGIQAINIDVVLHPFWRAGPAIGAALPRGEDDLEIDGVALNGVPEVDFSVELGGFIGFETPFGPLPEGRLSGEIAVRHDVAGGHDGLTARADLDYFFAVSRQVRFQLGVNATLADDDYFDSFFSVTPDAALASGLMEFDAEGGLKDVGVEANMIFSFSPKYGVFVRGAYNRLLRDAEDSPIVSLAGDADQVFVGGGLFFSF